ncbi:WecB/TagA/CpsF family glycosyltransferase [Cryobacterium luteum]|uniref:WecB/TagA/CpsF family glycosyltransferase n=1 Tax=Cryobacterium luteum TaxID=1424661 RepID=A0A1H8CEU0_9MICO|nr:WecB/TagA/CpsF family glycosyltransferase [Cryobacterium luteum]TFB89350.1 WecB/TagA/CpsF family glycosyltransferase [Cryobacterium luteum]SEM93492.1 polymer biosynthesis protein, WecB/TagA/CpsF family [Cryobacterium luteum]
MTVNKSRIVLGGSVVDLLEMGDALERISHRLSNRGDAPLAVASVNLDHVHHFGTGADLAGILHRVPLGNDSGPVEWLKLIDGAPLAAHARRLTGRAWPRLAGSDLIGPILKRAERLGIRVGFLGGSEDTHQRLRSEFVLSQPTLRVVGYWAPSREVVSDPVRSTALAAEIRSAEVDLLVVGLGKPRQELWIAQHGVQTGATVLLAFGAVVDFLAGSIRRAPPWITECGLEWAWRLALEPTRLASRYLVDGPAAYLLVRRTSRAEAAFCEAERRQPQALIALSPLDIDTGSPCGTIIIPAHNEADVIERTLGSIAHLAAEGLVEVIVVCNGCTDSTAAQARRFAGVTVQEIDTASKPRAMNVGDELAHAWPRLYLDADIEIAPAAVLEVFKALRSGSILAARPAFTYDTTGASLPVRSYYRARRRIPNPDDALWGAGAFGLNAAGHSRFGRFPEVTADDAFVDGVFSSAEKRALPTVPTLVRTPRHTAGLLAVLTRQRRGVVELGAAASSRKRMEAALLSARRPSDAADACWYAALTLTARVKSLFAARSAHPQWERDFSSRAGVQHGASALIPPRSGASRIPSARASLVVVPDE